MSDSNWFISCIIKQSSKQYFYKHSDRAFIHFHKSYLAIFANMDSLEIIVRVVIEGVARTF